MVLRAAFLFSFVFAFSFLNGQEEILKTKVTIKFKNQPLDEVLKSLENKANVKFSYSVSTIQNHKVTAKFKDEELSSVLAIILTPLKLSYTYFLGNIVINKVEKKTKKHTLSGFIYDANTGEKLIGANVVNVYNLVGTSTNQDGYYTLNLNEDSVLIQISYIGYEMENYRLYLTSNFRLDLNLKPNFELSPFVVTPKYDQNQIKPSEIKITSKCIKKFPFLFGEIDVLKSLQLLPGVSIGSDGSTGLNVRGGSSDQNLVLLDDVPIYNPSHIYGFFSVFNSDIIKDVKLQKGDIQSRYGGRLSSVIDIRTIDGNKKKLNTQLSLGVLSAKATLDGPISKNKKTTLVLSVRRSYFDVLNSVFNTNAFNNQFSPVFSGYYFYDLNGKIVHRFNSRKTLSFSFYKGQDISFLKNNFTLKDPEKTIKEKDRQNVYWGNRFYSARYNYAVNSKTFAWFMVSNSAYELGNETEYSFIEKNDSQQSSNEINYKFNTIIYNTNLSANLEFKPYNWLGFKLGTGFIFHNYRKNIFSKSSYTNLTFVLNDEVNAIEYNNYVEANIKPNRKLDLNLGYHYAQFNLQGVQYLKPQPRLGINYKLNKKTLLHASYGTSLQFMHLLTTSSIGLPIDLWVPSTSRVKPENSDLFSVGFQYSVNNYVINIEGFNKNMNNVIDYLDQYSYLGNNDDWQDKIAVGKGWAYGTELIIEKRNGKTTGWISYTLSESRRKFDLINAGKPFAFKFDRRHNLSLVVNREINKNIDFSSTFVYASGANATIPVGVYNVTSPTNPFNEIYIYGERNGYKFPDYHRIDFAFNFKKTKKNYQRIWSLGVYNAYNRYNAFYITPAFNVNNERVIKLVSLFPILPNFNYKIMF